ncbi:phosphopantetheine-binding protein [Candidatus Marinimicrobia bacterium]|nr:phosphopantetheine-binding protein [Candidatus Neomarinimicrobiota bacterium]
MDKKVLEIISKIIEENDIENINCKEISDKSILTNDLGFDSFNLAQLTVEIESEFGIDIFENQIPSTVEDILKQIK